MDPLPLIPEDDLVHEVAPTLRSALQSTLDGNIYPKHIAEQFIRDGKDEDSTFKQNAELILQVHENAHQISAKAQLAAADVMYQNALYLIQKNKIDSSYQLREILKLQRCNIFKLLENEFVTEFNLIQSSDLLPSHIYQFLGNDFRNRDHTICPACQEKITTTKSKPKKKIQVPNNLSSKTVILLQRNSFQVEPEIVKFHNYSIGETYITTVKIINTSGKMQSIAIKQLPTSPYFSAIIDDNHRLVPGLTLNVTVTFKPVMFRSIEDKFVLKNKEGEMVEVVLRCSRDFPILITCILKSNSNFLSQSDPGSSSFLEKRREALNSTIDCGSCLVSQYVLVSVIFENKGIDGTFFVMTEDDWFFQNVETVSTCMELFKGDFWIYPTFFKVCRNDVCELNIIFQPSKAGLHVEKLYLICDNNAFEQIEIMGDALEFSNNHVELKVAPNDLIISQVQGYCLYLGNVPRHSRQNLKIQVKNKSNLLLTCKWRFNHKKFKEVSNIEESWVTLRKYCTKLIPYETFEFEFVIHFDTENSGYHNIFLDFYITDIPAISLMENEEFICVECINPTNTKSLSQAVDLLNREIEVCAFVEPKLEANEAQCLCDEPPKTRTPKMGFSCPFIKFGIIPPGLNLEKEFFIRNDSNRDLNWTLVEVKYNLDVNPHMEIIKNNPHLSESFGYCRRRRNKKLFYKIINKKSMNWVSILVLISVKGEDNKSTIEDISIVTYKIENFDIIIKTKYSKHKMPALMSLQMMYRGIPTELDFAIENRSLMTGYFQFFPPFGEDRDRLLVELNPSSSVIKPHQTIKITATLICCEIGFIQNFFLPCFVGVAQEPLVLRVMCTVDGPHVLFYLPSEGNCLKKVTWPPKVVYEYDTDPWCICTQKECLRYEDQEFVGFDDLPFDHLRNKVSDLTYTINVPESCGHKSDREKDNGTVTERSFRSTNASSDRYHTENRKLEAIISEEFDSDQILHDDIIEVQQVPTFTPTKITLYIQNITPIATKYSFEPQRFIENKKFDHVAVRLHLKKKEELWNDLMGTEHGILVQVEVPTGKLNSFECSKVDIWIYANTYGIYSEEIYVDLLEMPSYHFSMLIEVVGCPLMLPLAVNSITKYPTLRFCTVPFDSEPLTRNVKISNTSSVPVVIYWHAFLKKPNEPDFDTRDAFNILFQMTDQENSDKVFELMLSMDDYCGKNTSDFCYVEPNETRIDANSSTFIEIILRPQYFNVVSKKIDAVSCLLGHIFLLPEHRKKPNYYIRKIGPDINSLKIEATITIEKPKMDLELVDEAYIIINMYANDVLLKKKFDIIQYSVLRNLGEAGYTLDLAIEEPLYFKTENGQLKSELTVNIGPLSTVGLNICCHIDFQQMLTLSELVYDSDCFLTEEYPFCRGYGRNICETNFLDKIIQLKKRMIVMRNEGIIYFPADIFIHFPRILVKPQIVQFNTVLLYNTHKSMVTIYNYTGYEVKFEIYKSSDAKAFIIVPHYGEIPKSTGMLLSSTNIFVYFTPTECKKYKASFKVVTNIPNYWVEIDLKGIGSYNAKFAIKYKI